MATHGKRLRPTYASLEGAGLLEKLGQHGETAVLEAFWRYHDPAVSGETAAPIFASGDERLLGLVLDEILSPTLAAPAPQAILNAIDQHRPALAKADAERLVGRLQDETPLHPNYEPARPRLLAWLLAQQGKAGDQVALDVIAGRAVGSEDSLRLAAYAHCRGNGRLLSEAAAAVGKELGQAPTRRSWQKAVEFIEHACRDEQTTPDPVQPIVQLLIETAPRYFPGTQFTETLRRLAVTSALDRVSDHLSQNMAESQGARAVIDLLPEISPAQRRADLWATALCTQHALAPVLREQTREWDEAEWRRVLRALRGKDAVHRPALTHVVAGAPIELTADVAHLVMTQVPVGDPLIDTVGERLRERLEAMDADGEPCDAWVAAVHWPKQRDEDGIQRFDAIASCLQDDLHVRLLVCGYLTKKLRADIAARLVPTGEVARALALIRAGGRGEWAAALAVAHPDEIAGAAAAVTTPEDYDLDVVAALAPLRSDVAFAGVAAAWPQLIPAEKDELVGLLEDQGDVASLEALCAVIRDDHRDNAKRRGRAARRISGLLEPGATLPEPVLDLLNSNLHDLRSAAVEAIARVKPRKPELIGRLHEVAAGRGAAGKAAADALDALAHEFIVEFAAASGKEQLQELMPLLAAVGRPGVLRPLFDYVGGNAVYDDPALHRAAAAAIREAAERIEEVGADDQESLVALIDGEQQESDVAARDDLSVALARLQLGEDAALKVLYDEIGITPKAEPDRLFGAEKEPLVRQLALYDRACKRGEDGWGAELAHMDNVAERLVRAAYLVVDGTSASIIEQIENDSRTPDYGNLVTALASTKQLNRIQAQCRLLHEARCTFSEIPHAGKRADATTMTTARTCFVELAKVAVGTLQAHHRTRRS